MKGWEYLHKAEKRNAKTRSSRSIIRIFLVPPFIARAKTTAYS